MNAMLFFLLLLLNNLLLYSMLGQFSLLVMSTPHPNGWGHEYPLIMHCAPSAVTIMHHEHDPPCYAIDAGSRWNTVRYHGNANAEIPSRYVSFHPVFMLRRQPL